MRSATKAIRAKDERGSVTAEFAAVLPAVIALLVVAIIGVQVAGTQVRLVAVAATAARLVGRGESAAGALAGMTVTGASIHTDKEGLLVCAAVSMPARLGILGSVTLSARSCALDDG